MLDQLRAAPEMSQPRDGLDAGAGAVASDDRGVTLWIACRCTWP